MSTENATTAAKILHTLWILPMMLAALLMLSCVVVYCKLRKRRWSKKHCNV